MMPTEEAVLFVRSLMLWAPALPSNCTVCLSEGLKTVAFKGEVGGIKKE